MSECGEFVFGTKVHWKVDFSTYFLARAHVLLNIIISLAGAGCVFDGKDLETSSTKLDLREDWGLSDLFDDLDDSDITASTC